MVEEDGMADEEDDLADKEDGMAKKLDMQKILEQAFSKASFFKI